jgi:hypothetical protein
VRPTSEQIAAEQLLFRYRVARQAYLKTRDFWAGDVEIDFGTWPIIRADDGADDFYRAVFYGEAMGSMSAGDLQQLRTWVVRGEGHLPIRG